MTLKVLSDDGSGNLTTAVVWDAATQATWFVPRSYMTPTPSQPSSGVFVDFQCKNMAGTLMSGLLMNAGFIDGTSGKENSDTDFIFYVDGQRVNISMCGTWPAGKQEAMLGTWPGELIDLGGPVNKWKHLYLREFSPRPGMPPGTKACVKINGRYAPLFD
jgi:hypothetical protein